MKHFVVLWLRVAITYSLNWKYLKTISLIDNNRQQGKSSGDDIPSYFIWTRAENVYDNSTDSQEVPI